MKMHSNCTSKYRHFFTLGWTAFGGPTAHLGIFESMFVERLQWFRPEDYAEVVAVASILPGTKKDILRK